MLLAIRQMVKQGSVLVTIAVCRSRLPELLAYPAVACSSEHRCAGWAWGVALAGGVAPVSKGLLEGWEEGGVLARRVPGNTSSGLRAQGRNG